MKKTLQQLQTEFVQQKFGMFIHFNSATVQFHTGDIEDWEFGHENYGHPRKHPFNPADWNPTELDCDVWAELAANAGMKFAALTAKHHEGFCLWNTDTTEHSVNNATLKRDVVAEYLAAFRSRGINAGLYFSIIDLTANIGRGRCTAADKDYTIRQITELLTNYGEIPFLIIDGWAAPWGGPSFELLPYDEIRALVTKLQPNCLLMNIGETKDLTKSDVLFFESAAGQSVAEDFKGPGASCNILTKTWFWRATDPALELRTADWVTDTLAYLEPKNTAFILNLSPNTTGGVDENMKQRYAEIAAKNK